MKKLLLLAELLTLVACNSKTQESQGIIDDKSQSSAQHVDTVEHDALDWAGTYEGVIPCADCEGIKLRLILNNDKSYSLTEEYLSNNSNVTRTTGTFSSNKDKPFLITLDKNSNNRVFFIGEKFVEIRDIETGEKLKGELNYTLKKVSE